MSSVLDVAVMQTPGSLQGPESRLEWLINAVDDLSGQSIDLLILPELYMTGYNIGDNVALWAEKREGSFSREIAALAKSSQMAIHVGYAELDGNEIYNSAACYDKTGALIGHHRKLLLPPGFEANHFTAGKSYSYFDLGGFKVATLICYDAEFPETFRTVTTSGCDLVVVPTALGAQWGIVSESVIPTRAFENGVFICYSNHCGVENDLEYFGGSCIVGPDGKDLARAASSESCLMACLEMPAIKAARSRLPYHNDRLKLP